MSAVAEAPAAAEAPRAVVRFSRLLSIYLIVPLCLLFILADAAAGAPIRPLLPRFPEEVLLFTLIFNVPHIVASHLIFIDRGYLSGYRAALLRCVLGGAALTAVFWLLPPRFFGAFCLVITFYHITMQQIGLTGAQLRTADPGFNAWKWLSVVGASSTLFAALQPVQTEPLGPWAAWLPLVGLALLLPTTLLAVRLHRSTTSPGGRRYLWATQGLHAAMLVAAGLGYPIFVALMPRVVHDLTAFYVYNVHDQNHNQDEPRNHFYRLTSRLGLSPAVAGPLAAVALAYLITDALPKEVSLQAVYWLSLWHYYLEGQVWKRGTIHRESTPFA